MCCYDQNQVVALAPTLIVLCSRETGASSVLNGGNELAKREEQVPEYAPGPGDI